MRDNPSITKRQNQSLEWHISDREIDDLRTMHSLLRTAVDNNKIGRFDSSLLDGHGYRPLFSDASHHMGAVRKANDSATSVVDSDTRGLKI